MAKAIAEVRQNRQKIEDLAKDEETRHQELVERLGLDEAKAKEIQAKLDDITRIKNDPTISDADKATQIEAILKDIHNLLPEKNAFTPILNQILADLTKFDKNISN